MIKERETGKRMRMREKLSAKRLGRELEKRENKRKGRSRRKKIKKER